MKFVKLVEATTNKPFEGWFLLAEEELSIDMMVMLNQKMRSHVFKEGLDHFVKHEGLSDFGPRRFRYVLENELNYNEMIEKYGPIVIRQIGSWMTIGKNTIISQTVERDSWPIDNEQAEIVICENDLQAEPTWLNFLDEYYPGKVVGVINSFRDRSVEDIKLHFQTATHITFQTTFGSFDWFEKLLVAMVGMKGKTVIGFTYDSDKWEKLKSEHGDLIQKLILAGNNFIVVDSLDNQQTHRLYEN